MKKSILLIITLAFLNACAEYTALVGPTYTMAKSGSIAHTGTAYASSYGIKKTLGQSPGEYVTSLIRKNNSIDSFLTEKENLRECQTTHSSSLSEIFFETLDEIDCFQDPFNILK